MPCSLSSSLRRFRGDGNDKGDDNQYCLIQALSRICEMGGVVEDASEMFESNIEAYEASGMEDLSVFTPVPRTVPA